MTNNPAIEGQIHTLESIQFVSEGRRFEKKLAAGEDNRESVVQGFELVILILVGLDIIHGPMAGIWRRKDVSEDLVAYFHWHAQKR